MQPAAMTDRREPATATRLRRVPSDGPRLLTVQAAASVLGLPYSTTRDLILRGTIQRVSIPGLRRLLVDRKDLDRAIDSWKETAERA
jgi:excisionase family DNA binding protein